jgi:hypothetical protein
MACQLPCQLPARSPRVVQGSPANSPARSYLQALLACRTPVFSKKAHSHRHLCGLPTPCQLPCQPPARSPAACPPIPPHAGRQPGRRPGPCRVPTGWSSSSRPDGRAWVRKRGAKMSTEPTQLRSAARCGAHARTTGRPCMAPAVKGRNGRCRMHGAWSGGPTGSRNGAYRHGRSTREAKRVSAFFREMRRDADELTATTMHAHGLKPVKAIRRKAHVRRALAAAAKTKGEGKKP